MNVNVNTFVTLQHYKKDTHLKGTITAFSTTSVSIKLLDFENFNDFSKGDPVVLYFSSDDKVCTGTSTVFSFDPSKKEIVLSVEKFDYLEEKRLHERFPLSKPCFIQIGQSLTKHQGIIKNLSFSGLMVICEADFPIYQKLKVTFNLNILKNPVELYAIVIRKDKSYSNKTEYGLKIIYIDEKTPKIIKHYLFKLKKGYKS